MGKKISIVLLIILPFVLCIFAGIKLNDWLGNWTGAICATSILINIYVFLGSYYFYKSERFYLWIQRQDAILSLDNPICVGSLALRESVTYGRYSCQM